MSRLLLLFAAAAALAYFGVACGGSDSKSTAPTVMVASPVRPGGTSPAVTATAAATPGTADDATQEALTIDQLRDIAPIVLASAELPAGYTVRAAQPITRGQVIASQLGVPKLARYLSGSDLAGDWVSLYTKSDQTSSISSIIHRFATGASAGGFVDATAGLVTGDYPTATSIERVQAESIGDKSVFMRYHLPGARLLEYTWSQGRLVGDIVLRYAGDTEGPDDVGLVVSLARKQEAKMLAFAQ